LAEVNALTQKTYNAWFEEQIGKPQTLCVPLARMAVKTGILGAKGRTAVGYGLTKLLATGQDALRARIAYSLLQYFVVSVIPGPFTQELPLGSGFFDLLAKNAFGNFRQLLEDVSLSPAMGIYLSHIKNQKENPASGRLPDENYAREIMQLFTIGLNQLNQDGTLKLDGQGKPIETYTNADITGLAKVFTGFSWAGPDTGNERFLLAVTPGNGKGDLHVADHTIKPMQSYPQFTSTSEKRFLGVTIPAKGQPDSMGDLKIALDTLFNHPNTPPFFCKQMVQRLVTSNPSPNYVKRVADVFVNDGTGKRGNLNAVFRAILLDADARNPAQSNQNGKIREPAVSFFQLLRTFNATSDSGIWRVRGDARFMSSPTNGFAQYPLFSPSVFNFYQPDYRPAANTTETGKLNLAAPEMQIKSESTVAAYMNVMRKLIEVGIGDENDVKLDFSSVQTLAANPVQLVDTLNMLLAGSRLNAAKKKIISDAVSTVPDNINRAKLATFLDCHFT
jgi:uncharacterized protein (DUF1800 family)